jgi:hypothetical protein
VSHALPAPGSGWAHLRYLDDFASKCDTESDYIPWILPASRGMTALQGALHEGVS